MAQIANILQDEEHNVSTIRLYREGLFYKAYEHSAYAFYSLIKAFKVTKRKVKIVDAYVVSLGFPSTNVHSLLSDFDCTEENGVLIVSLKTPVDPVLFDKWKNVIPTMEKERLSSKGDPMEISLRERIMHFPLEQKTPIECIQFLSELKSSIS